MRLPKNDRKYDPDLVRSLLRQYRPFEAAKILGVSKQQMWQLKCQHWKPDDVVERERAEFKRHFGMSLGEIEQIRKECEEKGLRDPTLQFARQRGQAKARGVQWQMNFGEWWSVWDGNYEKRGNGPYDLVMCRRRDCGPYSVENVFLDTGIVCIP